MLACAVHGVLSGPAIERHRASPIDQMIITNTIPLDGERARCKKIKVLSVARLLGQAIRSIHEENVGLIAVCIAVASCRFPVARLWTWKLGTSGNW